MAILKCKMCGGTIEFEQGATVGVCDSCGTKQTLPKTNDDVIANLFNRANNLRLKCEFDKAAQIYEKIVEQDDSEAEAHWGIVLCKYGIEYVEDPKTFQRIPTCHRTLFQAVTTDTDYLAAIDYSDTLQQQIYESEARAIDKIQKNILAIVENEQPFDVFICYKETDESGKRTVDSTIANDIYYQLTQEGFKVFFAAITLEDKLGQEYEPYIFAALNSAKVMLVLGTRPEYFSAVWVRNEWARYLQLMKTDRSKLLIPCYRDMDAYDLPEEFAHLQAQDMSKIGFINDVVRGIKKVAQTTEPQVAVVKETVVTAAGGAIDPLLKRVFMFLEDGDWTSANEYCEKVLDMDPECAAAYLGKLMAELHVRKQEKLKDCDKPFDYSGSYQKVLRFGDEKLKKSLIDCVEYIKARNEEARLEDCYSRAMSAMTGACTGPLSKAEKAYKEACGKFRAIKGYKDADVRAKECEELAEEARKDAILERAKNRIAKMEYDEAIKELQAIPDWRGSNDLILECEAKIAEAAKRKEEHAKELILSNAKGLMQRGRTASYEEAIKCLSGISGWKDADELAAKCRQEIEALEAKAEQDRIDREKRMEQFRQEALENARKKRIERFTVFGVFVVALALLILFVKVINPALQYNKAVRLMQEGNASEASELFVILGDYKDSVEKAIESKYANAINLFENERMAEAYELFVELGEYKDCREKAKESKYNEGIALLSQEQIRDRPTAMAALNAFTRAGDWADAQDRAEALRTQLSKNGTLAAGHEHTVAVCADGMVKAVGSNESLQCSVQTWKDIVAVTAGSSKTIGLKRDGTVVSAMRYGSYVEGQVRASEWENIVAVASTNDCYIGLKSDGTVLAVGSSYYNANDVYGWRNVVGIAAGNFHTVGLKADGTVVAAGNNGSGQCNVSGWRNIIAVYAGYGHTVGLKADGTVIAAGANREGERSAVAGWSDIVMADAGGDHIVGLKSDGTVVAVGSNSKGQCDVSEWKDIVAIAAGYNHTIGLKSDGTVIATGDNGSGRCFVSTWKNIDTSL